MINPNISIEKIIELYTINEESLAKIAKIAGYKSKDSIKKILLENNTPLRKYSSKNNRKRKINEKLFENIDSHDKAYLLGLLCSDGSIDKNGYGFQITSKDIEVLEYCKEILESEHKICEVNSYDKRTDKTYKRYNIHFCSKKITSDLIRLGLTNNKSFTCIMPIFDDNYFWSFLKGLFDGDGSVSCNEKEGKLSIKFIASNPIMNKIKEMFLKNNLSDTKLRIVSENETGIIYSIKQNSYNDVLFLREKMYENNSKYFLNRKYDILQSLKKFTRGCYLAHKNKAWKKIRAINLISNEEFIFENIHQCVNHFNIKDIKYIYRVLNGERKKVNNIKFEYV